MISLLLWILLLLLLSAFFSGTEIAFVTANKLGVEIERDKGTRRSKMIARFYENPRAFLSAILVGNNIVLVLFAYSMAMLIEPALVGWIPSAFLRLLIVTIVSAFLIVTLGEFFPKVIFRTFANRSLLLVSYPMAIFQWLLRIPAWLLLSFSNIVLKYILRVPVKNMDDAFTRNDLQDYVEGSLSNDQDELEADMFKNALHLKHVKARECMVPRNEIVHVDVLDGMEEVKRVFLETRHSRILITEKNIDNILGYIHHQSMLKDDRYIRDLIIPVRYVPEVTNVLDIMTSFKRQKNNIAVVVDEFGGTAGIITLEDITEEIFGEIEDEHDDEVFVEEQLSETEYRFSGRLEIDYLNDKFPAVRFPEGEYETLSGYIVMTLGSIPEMGSSFEMDDYRFTIEQVTDKKIEEVRVELINPHD